MSVVPTLAVLCCLFSNAHCWAAPSIWRRLLMHALAWEVVRALTKLGIAIAARRPIMATTIMISTSVKPDLRVVLFFILTSLPFSPGSVVDKQAEYKSAFQSPDQLVCRLLI